MKRKVRLYVKNQLNDGLAIEFCCGEKEYVLNNNDETVIEIDDDACMYFDIVRK